MSVVEQRNAVDKNDITVVTTAGPLKAAATGGYLTPYGSANDDALKTEVQQRLSLRQPRVLKRFTSLNDITFSDSGVTSTRIIDQSAPWGRPALKMTIVDGGAGGTCEVRFVSANIPEFDDHVVWRIWVDDYTNLSQIQAFIGNDSSYTKSVTYTHNSFNSNTNLFSGPRTVVLGPRAPASVAVSPTFVFGTDTLVATKLRFAIPASQTAVIWIDAIEVPARQRPIVCLSFDDCDVTLKTHAQRILDAYGLKGTFGINSEDIDGGALNLTTEDVAALSAAGHQVTAHNQNNNKLLTLCSAGRLAGIGTPLSLAAYLAEYRASCSALEAITGNPEDFCYHAWVQGGFDGAAMEEFQAAGVRLARSVVSQDGAGSDGYGGQLVYGSGLGNLSMCMPWIGLGSTYTSAEVSGALSDCVKYGTVFIPSGHAFAETSSDTVTFSISDFEVFVSEIARYKASNQIDCLTMSELADRLRAIGVLEDQVYGYRSKDFVRQIGYLSSANFNSTADQEITLPTGQSYTVTGIIVTNVSVSLTTAAGGVYSAASKGGTALVANTQDYTALTGTASQILRLTIANSPTVSGSIYFSLTTGQGSAATGDIFVFGRPV